MLSKSHDVVVFPVNVLMFSTSVDLVLLIYRANEYVPLRSVDGQPWVDNTLELSKMTYFGHFFGPLFGRHFWRK